MGGYGGWNPFPFQYGGGMSDVEATWRAMRKAVGGPDGLAGPEMGLEDSWRFAKAETIAAACAGVEHAAFQALPNKATEALPVYEELFALAPADTDPLETRRVAAAAAYTSQFAIDIPSLRAELQAIDPRADVEQTNYTCSTLVQFGKTLGDRTGTLAYGLDGATDWPNYSTDFELRVFYTLPSGQTAIDQTVLGKLQRFLRDVLPAWVDFSIRAGPTTAAGFYLDGGPDGTSLLDQSVFD